MQGARLLLVQLLGPVYLGAEGAEAGVGVGKEDIVLCGWAGSGG